MNFSKAQLEGQNKTQLVDLTLRLQSSLDAVTGKALSSAEVEKKILELQSQTIKVKSESQSAEQAYQTRLAEITADKELAMKKLELEYSSNVGKNAAELSELYSDLEAKAEKAKEDLTFGLREHEISTKEQIQEIEGKLATVSAEYEIKVNELKEKVEAEKSKTTEEIAKLKVEHSRAVEDLDYNNKIAIRDKKLDVAEKIAKSVGKTLVADDELEKLKDFKASSEEEVAATIEAAVTSATQKVYASEGAKYNSLKSSTEKEIALLSNDKAHLESAAKSDASRIADLESRLKEVPSQIAKAVEAAKSNTTVNQQTGK